MAPPSTCISWYFLPSISTSISTGWKAPGIAADARRILRNRSSASGWPLAAIAPMFQITGRWASRSVVPISSRRPLLYSRGDGVEHLLVGILGDDLGERRGVGHGVVEQGGA